MCFKCRGLHWLRPTGKIRFSPETEGGIPWFKAAVEGNLATDYTPDSFPQPPNDRLWPMASSISVLASLPRYAVAGGLLVAACATPLAAQLPSQRFEKLANEALQATETFRPAGDAALESAAVGLRQALVPLDTLLNRSKSGDAWRTYLDWPALQAQAASGVAADPATLRRLEELLNAIVTGLDMPEFVRVRKAVTRYAEVADAARGNGANRMSQRLGSLASSLLSASATGSAESLATVPPILERLTEAGQAPDVVAAVRGANARPNILLEVHESLLAQAVNRPIDQVMPVDEVVLGTRVRGSGRTRGNVRLDFVPSSDRAAFDLVFAATNVADTRGSQGPVTVNSRGVTSLGARRRFFLDEYSATASPVQASASTDTTVTGMAINSRFGKRLIQKIADRKMAETMPQAEAIAEGRARDRLRKQFQEQTEPALGQFRDQFQEKVRGPLEKQGLYPEMLHMNTTDTTLAITARKATARQLAAASLPPASAAGNLISARVHESAINNMLEEKLGGRLITQADVDRMAREGKAKMPDSLGSDADQKPWAVTFAKHRPVTLAVDDGRVKLMVRGDKFVSGDRSFPGMDIWATYAIATSSQGLHLIREGDVQIYPPGFKPGGGEKLSMAETSLRRILQKRFDKLWKQVIDIPDLPLQGELASAGPLTMKQLEARKDGWVVAGWCRGSAGNRSIESGPGTSVPAEILSGITGEIRDGSEFPVTETAQLAKVGGEIRSRP